MFLWLRHNFVWIQEVILRRIVDIGVEKKIYPLVTEDAR